MPGNLRKLIVFQEKNGNAALYHKLSDYQWQLHIATDLDDAIGLLKNNQFLAGLCLIDQASNQSYFEQLIKLFNYASQINWVMGLPGVKHLNNSMTFQERKLIADYCYDFLIFPVEIEKLLFSVGHAYDMAEISTSLDSDLADHANFQGIVGDSPPMRRLFKQIEKASAEDDSLLIEGETGTGKELVAHAIHARSHRADNPLVAINCGAVPQERIHLELFGYEKGAFPGADQRNFGRIEAAQGGTLFLDEIGDLPLGQQVHLLRFLEEKCVERIAGSEKTPVDVRVIAATHIDLKKAVLSGNFREDLYFRLKVLQIKMPKLRERGRDIERLALHFFDQFSKEAKRKPRGFSTEALYLLQQHDWPGNIRELMNCIRNAVIMSENRLLSPADLSLERRKKERKVKPLEEARADTDRKTIMASIKQSRYNMSRAADSLGISRVSLYRLIEKYRLKI